MAVLMLPTKYGNDIFVKSYNTIFWEFAQSNDKNRLNQYASYVIESLNLNCSKLFPKVFYKFALTINTDKLKQSILDTHPTKLSQRYLIIISSLSNKSHETMKRHNLYGQLNLYHTNVFPLKQFKLLINQFQYRR